MIAAVHVFIMSEVRIVEVSGLCLLYLEETYSLLKIDFAFFFLVKGGGILFVEPVI